MSKFKDDGVKIQEIARDNSTTVGLGSDGNIYVWDYTVGKWIKNWDWQNNDER